MMRALLIRGMLAGLLAGVLGFCFASVFGEPPVNSAIAFESYVEDAAAAPTDEHAEHTTVAPAGHADEHAELVPRSLQSTAGLGTGTLVYGTALGGIFALVFAAAYGRLGPLGARATAALVGGLGFTALYLVPFLKYPANPPAVGNPDTIQYRTATYLVLLVASVAAMGFAIMLRKQLATRFGGWDATLLAGAFYLAVVGFCYAVFPGINEVPQMALSGVVDAVTDADVTFPPTVLWAFRVSSLGLQLVLWGTIALVFGALAERQLEPNARRAVASPSRTTLAASQRA